MTYEYNDFLRNYYMLSKRIPVEKFSTIRASSQLKGRYAPENLIDGDFSTAWVEGAEGLGKNEWIEISFKEQFPFIPVVVIPGYTKSEKLFRANNRLKDIEIRAYYSPNDSISRIMNFDDYDFRSELPGHIHFPEVLQAIPMEKKRNHIQKIRFII